LRGLRVAGFGKCAEMQHDINQVASEAKSRFIGGVMDGKKSEDESVIPLIHHIYARYLLW